MEKTASVADTMERRDETGSYLGMSIAMASWAMFFATLFLSYLVLRGRESIWPPAGMPELPLALPLFNTLVLIASSVTLEQGIRAFRGGSLIRYRQKLLLAVVCGMIFLGLQLALWRSVSTIGVLVGSGTLGSVFYTMTGFHAVHVVGGLIALITLVSRAWRGVTPDAGLLRARLIAIFWHFLTVVWVMIFLAIFIL